PRGGAAWRILPSPSRGGSSQAGHAFPGEAAAPVGTRDCLCILACAGRRGKSAARNKTARGRRAQLPGRESVQVVQDGLQVVEVLQKRRRPFTLVPHLGAVVRVRLHLVARQRQYLAG